jgi:hypothetical protein
MTSQLKTASIMPTLNATEPSNMPTLNATEPYTSHYNGYRPHRSLGQRPPNPPTTIVDLHTARVQRRPILGGLINEYSQAA